FPRRVKRVWIGTQKAPKTSREKKAERKGKIKSSLSSRMTAKLNLVRFQLRANTPSIVRLLIYEVCFNDRPSTGTSLPRRGAEPKSENRVPFSFIQRGKYWVLLGVLRKVRLSDQRRVIRIALFPAAVKGGRVGGVEGRVLLEALGQVGVGEE